MGEEAGHNIVLDKAHVICKGNLTILRRILYLDLAKGNPKRTL
jgi:hypothetical protein